MDNPDADDFLLDMVLMSRKALQLMDKVSWQKFETNEEKQLAVSRLVEIIGEAARKVPHSRRTELDSLPWEKIVGMRHRLIHDYRRVNIAVVWQVVRDDLVPMIEAIESILPKEPED